LFVLGSLDNLVSDGRLSVDVFGAVGYFLDQGCRYFSCILSEGVPRHFEKVESLLRVFQRVFYVVQILLHREVVEANFAAGFALGSINVQGKVVLH